MNRMLLLGSLLFISSTNVSATPITFTSTYINASAGGTVLQRYTFDLSQVTLTNNQELAILFPHDAYQGLANGIAATGDLLLFQPQPLLAWPAVYSLFNFGTVVQLTGTFSVEVSLYGVAPGFLDVNIYSYDPQGSFIGQNTLPQAVELPEPRSWTMLLLGGACVVAGALGGQLRYRAKDRSATDSRDVRSPGRVLKNA